MHQAAHIVECLQQEMPSRVRRYFPELSDQVSIQVLHRGRPLVRRHSVLYELDILDDAQRTPRGVFVKIPRSAQEASVKRTYDTQLSLYALFTRLPEELNVVQPLDYLPSLRAIVTERIAGKELRTLLRASRRGIAHHETLRSCGRLLRTYHENLGQIVWSTGLGEPFLDRCQTYLTQLEGSGLRRMESQRMLAAFASGLGQLRQAMPVCLTSDDYSVGNILVQGTQIFLVEVTEPRGKAIYEDLATFLNSLTMLFWGTPWFVLGLTAPRTLREAFLRGYFADPIPYDLLSLFCAKNLCYRWLRALNALSRRRDGSHRAIPVFPLKLWVNAFFYRQIMTHLRHIGRC